MGVSFELCIPKQVGQPAIASTDEPSVLLVRKHYRGTNLGERRTGPPLALNSPGLRSLHLQLSKKVLKSSIFQRGQRLWGPHTDDWRSDPLTSAW